MKKLNILIGAAFLMAAARPAFAEPVTLDYWTIDKDGEFTFVLAKEFEKLHPDIHVNVKHVQFSDNVNDIMRAVATGKAPDLSYVDNPEIALFASKGALLDLTSAIGESKVISPDKIFPGPRAAATYQGKIYAIPRGANTICLYYNADLFKAAGLDPDKPPRSWDELYATAKKLTDPAKNVYGLAFSAVASEEGTFQFLPWLQMAGGDYDKLDNDGAVRALTFWQKLIDEKVASPDTLIRSQWDSTGTFNAGNAAMVISGPWELPRMQNDAKFEFRAVMLPPEKEGGLRASALGEGDTVIFKGSKHPKEAFMLAEYLFSQMPRVWNEFGYLPASEVEVKDPKWPGIFSVFAEQMKYARTRGPSPEWPKVSKAIQTAVQSTLTHQTDAKTALKTAQASVDQALGK